MLEISASTVDLAEAHFTKAVGRPAGPPLGCASGRKGLGTGPGNSAHIPCQDSRAHLGPAFQLSLLLEGLDKASSPALHSIR